MSYTISRRGVGMMPMFGSGRPFNYNSGMPIAPIIEHGSWGQPDILRWDRSTGLMDFTADANAAIAANPSYFSFWYTAKSIALVGAVAVAAYYIGKSHGR